MPEKQPKKSGWNSDSESGSGWRSDSPSITRRSGRTLSIDKRPNAPECGSERSGDELPVSESEVAGGESVQTIDVSLETPAVSGQTSPPVFSAAYDAQPPTPPQWLTERFGTTTTTDRVSAEGEQVEPDNRFDADHIPASLGPQTEQAADGQQPRNGMAIAGFVCALCAIVFFWTVVLPIPLWIAGVVLSGTGLRRSLRDGLPERGLAIAGLVISSLSFIVGLIAMYLLFAFLSYGSFADQREIQEFHWQPDTEVDISSTVLDV